MKKALLCLLIYSFDGRSSDTHFVAAIKKIVTNVSTESSYRKIESDLAAVLKQFQQDNQDNSQLLQEILQILLDRYRIDTNLGRREMLVKMSMQLFNSILSKEKADFDSFYSFVVQKMSNCLQVDYAEFLALVDLLKDAGLPDTIFPLRQVSNLVLGHLKFSTESNEIDLVGFGFKILTQLSLKRLRDMKFFNERGFKEKVYLFLNRGREVDAYWMFWGIANGLNISKQYHHESKEFVTELKILDHLNKSIQADGHLHLKKLGAKGLRETIFKLNLIPRTIFFR